MSAFLCKIFVCVNDYTRGKLNKTQIILEKLMKIYLVLKIISVQIDGITVFAYFKCQCTL